MNGPMPVFLLTIDSSIPPIPYDLEKAKSLLEESGWVNTNGDGIREKEIEWSKVDFEFSLTILVHPKNTKIIGDILKKTFKSWCQTKCSTNRMVYASQKS